MNEAIVVPIRQNSRVEPTSPAVPTRIIVRAACDFLLAGLAEGVRNYGSLRRAVFMTAIVVANVQHITRSAARTWRYGGLDEIPPDSERRPISILSLSQSLRKPFETTRAHVNALVDDGLCIKTAKGVIVPSEVLLSEKIAASDAALWEAFWAMIAKLRAVDYNFGAVLGDILVARELVVEAQINVFEPSQPPRRVVSRIMSEFYLNAIVEATAPHREDWVISTVSTAIMSHNSAAWSLKADEAWRYDRADTPPPDHLRTPASIADVVRLTGLGKELVRRKIIDLIAAGRVVRAAGGFLINMDYMQGPESRAGGAAIVTAFYRMIYDLSALGVDLSAQPDELGAPRKRGMGAATVVRHRGKSDK